MNKELENIKEKIVSEVLEHLNSGKKILVEVCTDNIELPAYAKNGDAGMDIRAAIDIIIKPGETVVVPTGLKMVIPDGYELQVRPRSGLSLKTQLRIANSPGTIDSGYRDEIGIIVHNTSNIEKSLNSDYLDINEKKNSHGTYKIKKGDRIAQIVLNKYEKIEFEQVDDVNLYGNNRGGGFGHTGT